MLEKIDEIPLPKEEQEVTVDGFIFQSGDVVVTPSTGKVMTKVTVVKDNNLVPENIVKDVNIFGVVGTVETVVELTQEDVLTGELVTFQRFIEQILECFQQLSVILLLKNCLS